MTGVDELLFENTSQIEITTEVSETKVLELQVLSQPPFQLSLQLWLLPLRVKVTGTTAPPVTVTLESLFWLQL